MNLKKLRKDKGLTQNQLAIRIGVSQQLVSKIESGKVSKVNIDILYKLATELNISKVKLFIILLKTYELNELNKPDKY